jgi:hypothetical protein
VVVPDEVTPLRPRVGETEAIHHIVQTAFEQDQQVGTGNTFLPIGFFKKQPKLLFRKAVGILDLLLFAQLYAVVRWFAAAPLSMVTGSVSSAIEGAFVGVATVTLQK